MKNNACVLLNILCSLFELSKGQYIMMNRKVNQSNQCDPNNTLVEQFFNVIFTEFHHNPPVCVCVQMCIERPTYCYPNGCLRKPDRIKPEATTASAYPVNRIQYDSPTKSVMFVVDNDKDLIDNIFEEPILNSHSERGEKPSNNLIFRPNPFKEFVFKYRKLPKLQMRYNLREKVKNTQSEKIKRDKLDVSKTRWPMNKHLLHGKQLFNKIRHYKKANDIQRTFFISMFPEIESESNMVSLNKKFLTKREDKGVNIDALYVYNTNAANFSIENLIDDLIIDSLDDNNNEMKLNANIHINESLMTTTSKENISSGNIIGNSNIPTNNEEVNTKMNIILINSTNKNLDANKYIHDTNSTGINKTFLEEIATMSEQIDKNNNVSFEFVKRVIGLSNLENEINTKNSSVDTIEINFDPILDLKQEINLKTNNTTTESNKISVELTAASKRRTVPILKTNIKQKSKQRIVRKLDRKLNYISY